MMVFSDLSCKIDAADLNPMQGRSTEANSSGHALLPGLSEHETQENTWMKIHTFIKTRCTEKDDQRKELLKQLGSKYK